METSKEKAINNIWFRVLERTLKHADNKKKHHVDKADMGIVKAGVTLIIAVIASVITVSAINANKSAFFTALLLSISVMFFITGMHTIKKVVHHRISAAEWSGYTEKLDLVISQLNSHRAADGDCMLLLTDYFNLERKYFK